MWGGVIVKWIPGALTESCGAECFQFFAPYKIALALIAYHGILMVLLAGASSDEDPRHYLHER